MKMKIRDVKGRSPQRHTKVFLSNVPKAHDEDIEYGKKVINEMLCTDLPVTFSRKCGCKCGCSPGFTIKDGLRRNVYISCRD